MCEASFRFAFASHWRGNGAPEQTEDNNEHAHERERTSLD